MANNLRIVYDNALDRATTLTASSTAAGMTIESVRNDIKSLVWRSGATTAPTITLQWPTAETIGSVAMAFCNLRNNSTIRFRGYTLAADATPAVDYTLIAVKSSVVDSSANAYSYTGGTYAVIWLPVVGSFQKVILTPSDTGNPAGYIEISKLVIGNYWSPEYNTEYGSPVLGVNDTSKHERSDAGDLRTERGSMHTTLTFDLNLMPAADRDKMFNIFRGNGMFKPLFVSLMPADTDTTGEQIFQVYGKLTRTGTLKYTNFNQFATQISIEEI